MGGCGNHVEISDALHGVVQGPSFCGCSAIAEKSCFEKELIGYDKHFRGYSTQTFEF